MTQKFVPILNKAGADVMLSAHMHEYENRKTNEDIHFPILVNSNNTVLQAEVDGKTFNIYHHRL